MRNGVFGFLIVGAVLLSGCGGGEGAADPGAEPSSSATHEEMMTGESPDASTPVAQSTASESTDGGSVPVAGEPCALLDPAYLNDLMQGEKTMLGTPYEFQEPLRRGPRPSCAWEEGSTGLKLRLTLESAATSLIDDHSGRAYNIDVEPVAVPQNGPGTSAVLLTDPAFAAASDDNFAYGYFFVADEVTVFVESVGLDLGAEKLRAMADEAADRIADG
ncbi:MAG: hypothetical protein Q4P07_11810 [Ornithinimicrobium sp.]|uniref:hypothetical protein n=1 Tax=Ornithinimicrobium sp. TaxID=1977084 RepID=UPI0026DF3300|nr:hypothetical protein [Ornithinimicrobium sp.]MDO5740818.1 hypothetical protein [Ornithinimicrobium sp.]